MEAEETHRVDIDDSVSDMDSDEFEGFNINKVLKGENMIDKDNIKKYRELKVLVEQARKLLHGLDAIDLQDAVMRGIKDTMKRNNNLSIREEASESGQRSASVDDKRSQGHEETLGPKKKRKSKTTTKG